jgi:hypothetical protein
MGLIRRMFSYVGAHAPLLMLRDSEKQYKTRFRKWNLKKYVTSREMDAIVRKRQNRREREGRQTDFKLRGLPVTEAKIQRTIKRRKLDLKAEWLEEDVGEPSLYSKRAAGGLRQGFLTFSGPGGFKMQHAAQFCAGTPQESRPKRLYFGRCNFHPEGSITANGV